MRIRCFMTLALTILLMGLVLPVAALPDSVFLGSFSEPFTTLFVTGEFVHPGELDWYSFSIVDDDSTIFILAENVADESEIRALLFDDEDIYIATTDGGYIEATLAAGTYRIRIDSIDSDAESYSLVVFNGMEVESNEGLLESNDLGEVTGRTVLFASLLPPGDADFFRLGIPESGLPGDSNAILIQTSGPMFGDAVLVLYQYSGSEDRYLPIAFDDDSGYSSWSRLLLWPEESDRYAIRVEESMYPLVGIDNYRLSITPVALSVDDEPNNTSANATTLALTSPDASTWSADGLLDAEDGIDFYRLTIEASALIHISTESQSDAGEYDTLLTLYTSDGDRLAENDNSGDVSWSSIVMPLDAGEYFVTIEAGNQEAVLVPYRLRAEAQPVKTVSETEPNDVDETAQMIDWAHGEALLIEAAIGLDGDVDSFQFVLRDESAVIFETGPRTALSESYDTTLSVYDEDLWEIAYNDDSNESWSLIETTLPAGVYYIVVESYYDDESFEYMLVITEQ